MASNPENPDPDKEFYQKLLESRLRRAGFDRPLLMPRELALLTAAVALAAGIAVCNQSFNSNNSGEAVQENPEKNP